MVRTLDTGIPPAHAFGKQLHIVVNDDDRIVYYHAQRDDKGGQRNRVQLNAKGIEQPQRDENGNRNGAGGHKSHAQRQQQNNYHHHGYDSNEKLFEEVCYRIAYDFALVGNGKHADI